MKIAISATGPTLDAAVEARFGRCPYYLIVDPASMAVETVRNPNLSQTGGVGTQSAQIMIDKGVDLILTGNCGPKAQQAFSAAGIQVVANVTGPVRAAIQPYLAAPNSQAASQPQSVSQPGTQSGWTPGAGRATAGRRGMGGGHGGGGGRGGGPA